eukprot:2316081-Rhodomonas_salina.2
MLGIQTLGVPKRSGYQTRGNGWDLTAREWAPERGVGDAQVRRRGALAADPNPRREATGLRRLIRDLPTRLQRAARRTPLLRPVLNWASSAIAIGVRPRRVLREARY